MLLWMQKKDKELQQTKELVQPDQRCQQHRRVTDQGVSSGRVTNEGVQETGRNWGGKTQVKSGVRAVRKTVNKQSVYTDFQQNPSNNVVIRHRCLQKSILDT